MPIAMNNSPTAANNVANGTGASDPSTYSVAALKTAAQLSSKFRALKSARARLDMQWKLNLAFYNSRQWAYIDRLGRMQQLGQEEGDKPRYRVRIVSNQIVTGAQSLLSKYTKTRPVITATPGSASDHDVKAAQMSEDLLEYWWEDFHLDDLLSEAMLWGIIAGQGYWKITWDEHAGKPMRFTLGPDGKPILNDDLEQQFRMALEKYGIDPQEQVIYMGDIKVEAISPFNVYLDPSAKTFKDCKWAICVHYLDPDEIKMRWGVSVTPDMVPQDSDSGAPFDNSQNQLNKTVKAVYEAYFLPSAVLPNGRYVTWIESPTQILSDEKWPFPTNELPLVKFPGVRVPGRIYDTSVVESAIPLQKELNKTLSQIVEYKNLTIKPRVWAPVGSLRTRITNEPGAVYEFTPIGGLKPEIETLPSMPPYVFEHLSFIAESIKEAFALTDVSEGTVPPNVEAGIAIDLLQEMSSDRLAPTIRLMESALQRAGGRMLELAQRFYIEPRLLNIRGSGGNIQVKKFTQSDINGGISVHVEAGSGLPRTRAGRQARIESYVNLGIIKPDQAWKYLDIADLKHVANAFSSDEDMAYRENEKMLEGQPLNIPAMEEAKQAVVTGVNPETGAPFQSPQEAMQYVQDSGLTPFNYENWSVHLDAHALYMKSQEFEALDVQTQQRFNTHYSKTFQIYRQLQPVPAAKPVNTTVQLRGTLGPTAAAEILSRSVPNITPEQMAEPPLDTIVMETLVPGSTDTPSQGGVGQTQATAPPDPMAAQGAAIENIAAHQQLTHAEELHQQKLEEGKARIQGAKNKAKLAGQRPPSKHVPGGADRA